MRRIFLLLLILLSVGIVKAFPLIYDNYRLIDVLPKGKITGDRAYEDNIIRVEFDDFTGKYPEFTLRNISNTPLTILWDLCALVDSTGRSQRIKISDTPFSDKGKPVPPTLVIPRAFISEIIVPLDSIEYDGEWIVNNSIPKEAEQTLTIVLTVDQGGKQTTYIFTFESVMVSRGVLVEGGTFTMGDTWGDGNSYEKPIHKVTFTYDFYIGKYETTFDEYDAFCNATRKNKPNDQGWGRGDRPVINVSWSDAISYCNWLSEKAKLPKAYDRNGNLIDKDGKITTDPSKVVGYRLPTKAEWEYAARGGNKSKGYKYAGSDNVGDVAWYNLNSGGNTHEVGTKAPNELGIYDMSGNVWEWCSDYTGIYSHLAQTNPYKNTVSYLEVRGSCWYDIATDARVANRDMYNFDGTDNGLGFRICRTVPYEGMNRPPLASYNPSPSDESIFREISVTLRWDSYDPDDDTMTYDVYFDSNVNPATNVSSSQTENTLNRSNLSYDTTYYWKVVSKDSHGAMTESPVWKFSIQEPPEPQRILVEKGSFTMGDPDGFSWEKPTHKVTFTYDFYIGKHEVTFDEYDTFCTATYISKPDDEGWGRGQRPVINVSWWDAIAYCNWLSEKENLPKSYDSNGNLLDKDGKVTTDPSKVVGYRLPTEAEWEYAARGGNKSEGYKYAGSNIIDQVAWHTENSAWMTHEVGKKAPNELGLYDMTGNVSEWCSDWYSYDMYSSSAQTNPYNSVADLNANRIYRGGSWGGGTGDFVSRRGLEKPTDSDEFSGFRICRTVPYEGENRTLLAPYNPSPSDEAVVWATSVTLSWDSYDPDDDAITYDVYFDTNTSPKAKVSSSQVENTLNRSNLSYGTTYYWRVVAKDSKGATTEGPVWSFTTSAVPKGMVLVEKGSFTMGDTWGGGGSYEKPTHKVTFTYNFYIGRYETTFDEYDAFCDTTGRSKPDDYDEWGRGSRPVIWVSWNDATAYCNWLSEEEKLPKAYDKDGNFLDKDGRITTDPSKVVGYRLPTEAEWEYAARGGKHNSPYKYSGSDTVGDVAWYTSNSWSTQEVGKKAPNELGIYDMSGNVWEWCSDRKGNYSSSAQTNPYENSGSGRVIRGGGWDISATYSRVANRDSLSPIDVYFTLGFRICRTVLIE